MIEKADWMIALDIIQAIMTIIGFIANILTCFVLTRKAMVMSRILCIMMMHQSIIDAVVCFMATIQILQPYMWMTGIKGLDFVICQFWHGQGLYWGTVNVSIYNLIVIAVERYLAICWPFKHADFSPRHVKFTLIGIYLYCYGIHQLPPYFQVKYKDGSCLPEYYFSSQVFKDIMYTYSVYAFFMYYSIPVLIFAFLYGSVACTLHRRKKDVGTLGKSRVIDSASAQLTKTAIVVTVFFAISVGYDLWYYVLGHTQTVEYKKNSIIQKIGLFLANSNSCANPFIYFAFMPMFRNAIIRFVRCQRDGDEVTVSATRASAYMQERSAP